MKPIIFLNLYKRMRFKRIAPYTYQIFTPVLAALLFLLGGVFIIQFALGKLYSTHLLNSASLKTLLADFYANAGTELLSIAITVLVIDWLNRRRAIREQREDLFVQLFSPNAAFAVEALRILRYKGLIYDGDLSWQILKGVQLPKADLSKLDLSNSSFDESDLQDANLRGCNLQSTSFHNSNLKRADFRSAELQGASFSNVNLQQSIFDLAKLQGAYMADADLKGADLSQAEMQGVDLTNADLQGAHLGYSNLEKAELLDANLKQANLGGTDFRHANLKYANLEGANLCMAKLEGANLEGATMPDGKVWKPDTDISIFIEASPRNTFYKPPSTRNPARHIKYGRFAESEIKRNQLRATKLRIIKQNSKIDNEIVLAKLEAMKRELELLRVATIIRKHSPKRYKTRNFPNKQRQT